MRQDDREPKTAGREVDSSSKSSINSSRGRWRAGDGSAGDLAESGFVEGGQEWKRTAAPTQATAAVISTKIVE